ncbi:MAG TPA: KpsF/GutQ family sugar-phosphate isomerase [Polyangiaceae bacterium]|nr:KpsF/GutQ family sugar-phosphate isomerase [Polyangiaceae bacterium]
MVLLVVAPPLSADEESPILRQARELLREQADAVTSLAGRLDASFQRAVDLILGCRGRVVVCGVGKSGLVGRKIAATFSSTGTPAFFLHAGEASHGDLGMVTASDAVLLISNSGETEEVLRLVPYFKELGLPMVAVVGRATTSLGDLVDVVLDVSVERESCPLNLAPTTSALVTQALGDALAVSLIRARDFRALDFARFHPGGALGNRLNTRVRDVMKRMDLPFVVPEQSVKDCLMRMTEGRLGLAIVVDGDGGLAGIVTDGDLRRGLQKDAQLLESSVDSIMTRCPITIDEGSLLIEAEQEMQRRRIKALIATDASGRVTGVVEIFAKKRWNDSVPPPPGSR